MFKYIILFGLRSVLSIWFDHKLAVIAVWGGGGGGGGHPETKTNNFYLYFHCSIYILHINDYFRLMQDQSTFISLMYYV